MCEKLGLIWSEFRVGDLFGHAKLGRYHNPNSLVKDPAGYTYITASNRNNGVPENLPCVNGNVSPTTKNIISWGKQCPAFFYHQEECVTGQGMYYIELGSVPEMAALYLCSVLNRVCEGQFDYKHCLIGSFMDNLIVLLPATIIRNPNWIYMDGYMRNVCNKQNSIVKSIDGVAKV